LKNFGWYGFALEPSVPAVADVDADADAVTPPGRSHAARPPATGNTATLLIRNRRRDDALGGTADAAARLSSMMNFSVH
jgi:hypothetical protein